MSDLVRTVAAVFVRKSADGMPASAFKHALSLDLRWFSPAEARRVLMHAVEVGLLTVDGDTVTPAFDVKAVRMPVDFRPTPAVLDEQPDVPGAPAAEPAAPASPPAPEASEDAPGGAAEDGAADHAPEESLVDRLVKEAAVATMQDPADVRRAFDDERTRREGVLDEDVAALTVARRHGVDVKAHAARLLRERADEHA